MSGSRLKWIPTVVLAFLASTHVARADGRTSFLVEKLKAEDFKVRTNAALALGQTDDDAAIAPLCGALIDSSDVVRQSAAVALKRLNRTGALGCLRGRLLSETSDTVKLQISRAIEAIDANGTGSPAAPTAPTSGPPKFVPNAKFYVALSTITNNSARVQTEVDAAVAPAIRDKLDELGGYQIAPDKESPEAARATMSKRNLKGFYLSILVDKFDYSDGNLSVKVKVAVFTYPGKDLRGEIPARLTQTGVRPGDTGAEDNLMNMAASRAIELFAQNLPNFVR